jgi:hypothetical protein
MAAVVAADRSPTLRRRRLIAVRRRTSSGSRVPGKGSLAALQQQQQQQQQQPLPAPLEPPEHGPGELHRSLASTATDIASPALPEAEAVPDLAAWFVQQWQAHAFMGLVFFPHHGDPVYRDGFLRAGALHQALPSLGGRLVAVTSEPWASARAGWRPETHMDVVVDPHAVLAGYLNSAGLLTVAVQASVSRRFALVGPAVVVLARSGRVLFAWCKPPGDPGPHGERSVRGDVILPEHVWRRVRRVLEEEEGIVFPPASSSLQAATADLLRGSQAAWPWRALSRLRFWAAARPPWAAATASLARTGARGSSASTADSAAALGGVEVRTGGLGRSRSEGALPAEPTPAGRTPAHRDAGQQRQHDDGGGGENDDDDEDEDEDAADGDGTGVGGHTESRAKPR